MANSKVDQTGDVTAANLHRYAKLYDLPEYVKTASADEIMQPEKLPTAVYADVRLPHQFPCHTKAATYLSWLYFLEKRSEINPKFAKLIEGRLTGFANDWAIAPEVESLKAKVAAANSTEEGELPDSKFAYVWASETGQKDRRYPLRNALEVKAAAAWFESYRDNFTYDDRKTIATKILEKAAEYGASIDEHDDMLQKQAGYGFCHPKQAAELVSTRAHAGEVSKDLKDHMQKLAHMLSGLSEVAITGDLLSSVAATVDQFDRLARLKYSEVIKRPEDVLFGVTHKAAADMANSSVQLVTGSVYEQDQLAKLALGDVRDMFGDEIADAVRDGLRVDGAKMAEIAHTFPRPDAARLDQILSETGIRPIAKQASVPTQLHREHLTELARLYS